MPEIAAETDLSFPVGMVRADVWHLSGQMPSFWQATPRKTLRKSRSVYEVKMQSLSCRRESRKVLVSVAYARMRAPIGF